MATRIPWDEQEALLLLDVYDLAQKHPENRKKLAQALSTNLRRRAEDRGVSIDDDFRNLNGIQMRLLEIERIIHPDEHKFGNTSELFRSTTALYLDHRRTFQKKVTELQKYRVKILSDLVTFTLPETVVLLSGYLRIGKNGETLAHTARLVSAKLRALAANTGCVFGETYRSEIGINGRLRRMGMLLTGNNPNQEPIPQVFVDAANLYWNDQRTFKQILKDTDALIGKVVLPEDIERKEREKQKRRDASPVKKTKYITTKKDRKLCDQYEKSFTAVYKALERRYDTDPHGVSATTLFSDLKKKIPRKDIFAILNNASWAKSLSNGKYVHISGAMIMAVSESNGKEFFSWAKKRLPAREYAALYWGTGKLLFYVRQMNDFKKSLFAVRSLETVNNTISRLPELFPNPGLREAALKLLLLYKQFLEEKENADKKEQPVIGETAESKVTEKRRDPDTLPSIREEEKPGTVDAVSESPQKDITISNSDVSPVSEKAETKALQSPEIELVYSRDDSDAVVKIKLEHITRILRQRYVDIPASSLTEVVNNNKDIPVSFINTWAKKVENQTAAQYLIEKGIIKKTSITGVKKKSGAKSSTGSMRLPRFSCRVSTAAHFPA